MRHHIFYFTVFISIIGLMPISTVDAAEITEYFNSDPSWQSFNLPVNDNDFGFRNSNFAGGDTGEVGGFFSRTDQIAWYGDDTISNFTGNKVLNASGLMNIYNVEPGYDNNIHIGHFNSNGPPELNGIGFQILENESTNPFSFRIFYKIGPTEGFLFIINGINESRTWSYLYDPDDGSYGSLTVSISGSGGNTTTVFLSESQRNSIGTLNYFGLSEKQNSTSGSEQCEFYIDNVSYTVDALPVLNPQNSHYYQLVEINPGVNWYEARDAAAAMEYGSMQGHLATLTSPEEEEFVVSSFPQIVPNYVWLGATDEEIENDWKWITAEPWSYTNWVSPEPNGGHFENCLDYADGEKQWNDENCNRALNFFLVEYSWSIIEVDIDIKPGNYPNSINLKSRGKVPVAILTTDDFYADDVDPESCVFAGASPLRWHVEDVDSDGEFDVVMHYMTQELNLNPNSTDASIECETSDGTSIIGTDTVNIVPNENMHSKKAKKKKKK